LAQTLLRDSTKECLGMFEWFERRKVRKELRQALSDGHLDQEEVARLKEHPDEILASELRSEFRAALAPVLQRAVASRRFSPDDEEEIATIDRRFGAETFNPLADDDLYRFRQLWAAENGQPVTPRPVEAPFMLRRGELCYMAASSTWQQTKTTRQRVGSHGHSFSFRIMKGWSYRVSEMRPVYETYVFHETIAKGVFCVTNKRIVFEALAGRSCTIPFASIVDVELYSDGIVLKKTRGKHDIFKLSQNDIEYASLLISNGVSRS
jgi:hypothetical protein